MTTLDARLEMVKSLVPRVGVVADVGADHAHLALHMLNDGLCDTAIVSDISESALDNARTNVAKYGFEGRVKLMLADGITDSMKDANAVTIAGIGGQTIAGIIERRAFDPDMFIVSPHRDTEYVRRALSSGGYHIERERVTLSGGRFYVAIRAKRGNAERGMRNAELFVGSARVPEPSDPWREYFMWQRDVLMKVRDDKRADDGFGTIDEKLMWINERVQL